MAQGQHRAGARGGGGAHTPGAEAPPETGEPQYLWDEGGDPNALDLQRWAVFAPDNAEGRAMVAAVEALIRRRAEQSGHRAEPFFVPVGLTESQAHLWRKTVFEASAPDPHDLPRYQLILGDLDGVSLTGADLSGATLHGARLAFAQAQQASFRGADLRFVAASQADLSGADLSGADLTQADLSGCLLVGANLSGANLTGADLSDADLTDADLTGAEGWERGGD